MSSLTANVHVPQPVIRKVALLRWLVRLYVGLEGLAAVVLVLGSAFWLGLAIDWIWEPAASTRVVLGLLFGLAVAMVATRRLFTRILARLPNSSLALLMERTYPQLRESLVTTIEASDGRSSSVDHATMLRRTSREAAEAMQHVRLSRIFQFRPLLWQSCAATAMVLSIVAFAMLQNDAFGFWIERMRLSDRPWPRRVQLSVVGFDQREGRCVENVARDDDFQLQVQASILDGHTAPEQVEIHYRLTDGRRGRDVMTRVGEALPGRDAAQQFRYTFNHVVSNLEFDLVGGDDRIRHLRLHVVERPQIVHMLLECTFPPYMQRPPRTIPVSGRVELPEGTRAVCRVVANKPLKQVRVRDPAQQQDLTTTLEADRPQEVRFDLKVEAEDRMLLLTMRDQDGVENREPYRVVISVLPDEPPEVSVQLRGIGSAVTPQASIPFVGRVSDEYGLEQLWFEYQIGKQTPERRVMPTQPDGARKFSRLPRFDLAETDPESKQRLVALQPGQQLMLSVKARDAYDLQEQPHVGSSQRFLLDVVTNSELRALLEKRELGLRQRFEALYEKMQGTHELLDRIEVQAPEPADEPLDPQELDRRGERDRLRVSGALQNVTQLAYETLGVADGFEEIVAELINNRVDTEELKQRLQHEIADPLRTISGESMPELEERLQNLQRKLTDQDEAQPSLQAAKAQGQVVLEAMKQVLDRMLELESYNELVELLRDIVADQKQLHEQTKQLRRKKLRSLLDGE